MHPTPSTSVSPFPHRATPKRVDTPSPSKRRRLSPSVSNHHLSTAEAELDAERRRSSSRVLATWSALEKKYSRGLGEDDVVDLRSGTLLKDRGVLRRKVGSWDIGCFADSNEADAQGERDCTDHDEGEDDLGVWGSDLEFDPRFNSIHVPPVRELDPEDAKDLSDFLAAEKERKVLFGTDEGDDLSASDDETIHNGRTNAVSYDSSSDASTIEVEAESALAVSSGESDDELAGFDDTVGEGALLWEVGSELRNISESPAVEDQASVLPPPPRNRRPAQLCTPPLSCSSIGSSHDASLPSGSRRPSLKSDCILPPSPPRKIGNRALPVPFTASPQPHSSKPGVKQAKAPSAADTRDRKGRSLSPTKNIVAEIVLPPSHRANSVTRHVADMIKTKNAPRLPTQSERFTPRLNHSRQNSSSQPAYKSILSPSMLTRSKSVPRNQRSDGQDAVVREYASSSSTASEQLVRRGRSSISSPPSTKKGRAFSVGASANTRSLDKDKDGTLHTRGRRASESSQTDSLSSREHRLSDRDSRGDPKGSRTETVPPHSSYDRSSLPHPLSHDFWAPYLHMPPVFPMHPYPPNPDYAHHVNIATRYSHANTPLYAAPTMQNCFASGALPPSTTLSSPSSSSNTHSPSHPPSPWFYPSPNFPHAHSHSQHAPTPLPWMYPPYAYPVYAAAAAMSPPPFNPRPTDREVPSSSPDRPPTSPPPSRKRTGKVVSFSREVVSGSDREESSGLDLGEEAGRCQRVQRKRKAS